MGYRKPTRFWCGPHVAALKSIPDVFLFDVLKGCVEREAKDKILRGLPFDWQERLTKECSRKTKDHYWVWPSSRSHFR